MVIKKYSKEKRLVTNSVYSVHFELNGQVKDYSFRSRYYPLWNTVDRVKGIYPELLHNTEDDDILYLLWQNSLYIKDFVENSLTSEVTIDEANNVIPFAVKEYVAYKTAYDLIRDLAMSKSTRSRERMQLGTLEVEDDSSRLMLGDILRAAKEDYLKWEKAIDGGVQSRGAVRAAASEYPLNARVSF